MALLRELSFLPLNSRDEFTTLRKFLTMEEFKSEHLAEELEIATHFLKEPEAAEIRDILMERAAVGDVKRAAAFYKIIRYSYGSGCTSYGCQPFDIRKTFTIIWEANRRLKDTVIENKDFEALIRQYDRPNAFFIAIRRILKPKDTMRWCSEGRSCEAQGYLKRHTGKIHGFL